MACITRQMLCALQLDVTRAALTEAVAQARSANQLAEDLLLAKRALEIDLAQKATDLAEQVTLPELLLMNGCSTQILASGAMAVCRLHALSIYTEWLYLVADCWEGSRSVLRGNPQGGSCRA